MLVKALVRILRPLLRLLVAHGVTFPHLAELLKTVYVDVAEKEFAIDGKAPTDSRVSLLTGVHRKDIRRLRSTNHEPGLPPGSVSLGMQIVARWLADPAFHDDSGAPRALPRYRCDDGRPSFESLVEEVSRSDVRARSVLDEFGRLGIVELLDDDLVALRVEGFVPDRSFEEKAYFFGRISAAHLETATQNLEPKNEPQLDRAVFYDGLLPEDAEELAAMCHTLGTDALKHINREAMRMKRKAKTSGEAKQRICFGVFFNSTESE